MADKVTIKTQSKKPWAVVFTGSDHPRLADMEPHIRSTHVSQEHAQRNVPVGGPSRWEVAPIQNGQVTVTSTKPKKTAAKEAHGFAQTDTVKHCPFCGSGDVWGGSDGTITCEFCEATFQVSVEPEYPSAPGSINGQPLNLQGQPDQLGQADAEDANADANGAAPGAGEDQEDEDGDEDQGDEDEDQDQGGDEEDKGDGDGGGPPWLNKDDDEDGDKGAMPFQSSYRTFAGDRLPEHLYLKHLAIRHADDPQRFLASLRNAR